MTSEAFEKAYGALNPEQKRAVDTIEGPVMVVAGPGTGKTQILSLRIANILLKTDTDPSSILALTFTEAGSEAMRKRLLSIVGPRAYEIPITTFHGFCNRVISRFPESFPRIIGGTLALPADQIEIITTLLEDERFSALRPYGDPLYYVKPIQKKISSLKRDAIGVEEYKKMVTLAHKACADAPDRVHEKGAHKGKIKGKYAELEKRITRAEELALIYELYQKELRKRSLFDYDDMIMEVASALEKDESLRLSLQEEYQYVLADEHQDANGAQNKILELLVSFHDSPNLFIVGDEKQAIYRFQGASLAEFNSFKEKYPEAEIITLRKNYRSTQTILDLVSGVLPSELEAAHGKGGEPITVRSFLRGEHEYRALAEEIRDKQFGSGKEIAVLYRNNKDAHGLVEALEHAGVPFTIESDQEILGDIDMQKFLLLLRAVDGYPNDALFAKVLHLDFLGRDEFEIYGHIGEARAKKISLYSHLRDDAFAEKMKRWHKHGLQEALPTVFAEVVRESGFLAYLLEHPKARTKLAKLEALFDEVRTISQAKKEYRLADFIRYLDLVALHSLSLARPFAYGVDGVRLMTAHKSKGLEFDVVYLVNAIEKSWSGKARGDLFDLELERERDDLSEDERRLFYVALSRARRELIISYSGMDGEGREVLPSEFLLAFRPELAKYEDMSGFEKVYAAEPAHRFQLPTLPPERIQDAAFVSELFARQGLSVTSLGNYLDCPWKYFYRNLLRIPEAQNKHLMFGTAVHAALKWFFDKHKMGETPSKAELLAVFKDAALREPFTELDLGESLTKGEEALSGYYDTYKKLWRKDLLNEYSVNGVLLDDIKLVGKLDKIEILNGVNEVNVVDYKTGKPKSEREAEKAGYRRQLAFYKLLLDRYENGRYKMVSGEIDFVEPDSKGSFKKLPIVVSREEVSELEETVRKVAAEIRSLAFWGLQCEEKDCEYCALRRMMKV